MEISLRTKPKAYDHTPRTASPGGCVRILAALTIIAAGASGATPSAAEGPPKFGPDDLKLYCDGQERYLAIIREADEKFGIVGNDEKDEWMRVRDEANYAQMEKDLGAPYTEWEPVARSEWWNQRCEALWRGWVMIEEIDALSATSDDDRIVAEALELAYLKMMEKGEFKNHLKNPYTAVNCKADVVDDFHLIGCTLAGGGFFNGFFSDPLIFMVASKDGHPAFAPLKSNKDHMDSSYYTDADGNAAMTGWYVGSYPLPFDWAEAVVRLGR